MIKPKLHRSTHKYCYKCNKTVNEYSDKVCVYCNCCKFYYK